ncbi:MAG: FtsQ-type POTRA domain-containing protein [Armatimonadota bacterium]
MAVKRRKKKIKKKLNNTALFIISIFIIAQLLFFTSPIFHIESIDIVGDPRIMQSNMLESLNAIKGKHLFLIKLKEIRSSFQSIVWIKDIAVSYKFPGKLKIYIKNKKPYAYVRTEGKKQWYGITSEGDVMHKVGKPEGILKIVLDSSVAESSKIDSVTLTNSRKIYQSLPDKFRDKLNYIRVNSLDEYSLNGGFIGYNTDIKVGNLEDLDYKINLLSHILDKTVDLDKEILYIDLRYEQPVIKVKH